MIIRTILIAGAAGVVLLAPAAHARTQTQIRPYLEIDQTVFADFDNGGETSAYTSAAAGIEAVISTPRTEGQISYRYEHRFGWDKKSGDADVHSGIARARYAVIPGLLQIEGGALATRTRTDIAGIAANPVVGNFDGSSQLYSIYAGPTLATQIGDFDVGAAYRFGYTKIDDSYQGSQRPALGSFDSSTSQLLTANIGMNVGVLPVGWNVSGGYQREDSSELDQRFESAFVRADVTVPVSPTVAIVGGAGYEKIRSSDRDVLRNNDGIPVIDGGGRFVTDPDSPRLLAYDQSGFIWDVGVLWRPSSRTSLEAHIGRRYGSMTYVGSFSYRPTDDIAMQITVYDGIQTFGRQINAALSKLPTQFTLAPNPFGNAVGGCVFGAPGSGADNGAGNCLNAVLQSISSGTYRSRGVDAILSASHGPWFAGIGVGYAERTFLADRGLLAIVDGLTDRSYYAQAVLTRQLSSHSGIDGNVYINWYEPGLSGTGDSVGTGATGSYYHNFTRRLTGTASLGLFSTRVEDLDSSLFGAAQFSARYQF